MTTATETSDDDLVVQEHCIDLPGETVHCWIGGGTDKLKVILRKHRDVIFDIHLGNGRTYTLETTESDFYNARDKKLVYAARHGKVTFKDGERMHVWVSRGFRGSLILKCDDQVVSEVKPNEWDAHRHSDNPKEKPAPIIVAVTTTSQTSMPATAIKSSSEAGAHQEERSLHIIDASKKGAPPAILEFFENGGESLQLDSENIITRNWIISQLSGTGGYAFDNRILIKELMGCKFRLQRVIHKSGPKIYIIFTGNSKLREVISASRYGLQNTKIINITNGAGGAKQGWDAAKGAAKDSVKVIAMEKGKVKVKGGGLAVWFAIGMDVAEWYKDYSEIDSNGKSKNDFCDLLPKLGIDLAKVELVAALTSGTVALLLGCAALVAGTTVGIPFLLLAVGTIIISAGWTYVIERADRAAGHALGSEDTSTWLGKKFREIAHGLYKASKDVRYEDYAAAQL